MSIDDDRNVSKTDLKYFKKRAQSLKGFANVDLSLKPVAGKGKKAVSKNKKQRRDPVQFDALEKEEDDHATMMRNIQKQMQQESDGESNEEEYEEDELDEHEIRAMKAISKREPEAVTGRVGLPVRSVTGQWKENVTAKAESKDAAESVQATEATTNPNEATFKASNNPKSEKPLKSFEAAKEELALTAMSVTEDLEDNLNKLKDLLAFCRPRDDIEGGPEAGKELMQAGLVTLLAVLKDIIPGYSIRPLTDVEKNAVVSKEVKKLRNFDESILRAYSGFLSRLEEILKTNRRGDAALVPVAVACLGQMADFGGHFNHFERVLTALCSQLFKQSTVGEVALKHISLVFEGDEHGRSTAHILRLISDAVQARGYLNWSASPEFLGTLLQVRLKVLLFARNDTLPSQKKTLAEEAARMESYKRKSGHLSKSRRKELRAELEETVKAAQAEAEFSREERAKWSTDASRFLFRILFGVLKACEGEILKKPETNKRDLKNVSSVLPAVLKALSRFSQLLSVEFFADLLATLKRIISSTAAESMLSLTTSLHTIQAVVTIVQLQETASSAKGVTIGDLKFYFDLLYAQLTRLPREVALWSDEFEALIEGCMVKLFLSKRHVPAERVAAFAHRLAAVAARMEDVSGAHYSLRLLLRLLERHEKARAVLDSEVLGVAAYRPECADPDLCNPFCLQLNLDALVSRIQSRHGNIPGDLQSFIRKVKKLSLD